MNKDGKHQIAKGLWVTAEQLQKYRDMPGGSNVGEYPTVPKDKFAGPAGGGPPGSAPANTLERAKSALRLAHNFPKKAAMMRFIYRMWPQLKPEASKS